MTVKKTAYMIAGVYYRKRNPDADKYYLLGKDGILYNNNGIKDFLNPFGSKERIQVITDLDEVSKILSESSVEYEGGFIFPGSQVEDRTQEQIKEDLERLITQETKGGKP